MLCTESITDAGITQVICSCEIQHMETKQIRLENFRAIWQDRFNGKIAALARALGSSANQVRFYLNPEKPGGRWMGEDFARDIERILGLERNYLDREPGDDAALPPEDQRFINEVATGLHDRDIPEHIKQTILTLISSSPEKK